MRGVEKLDVQAQLRCKSLTFRAATHEFHIGYPVWKAIREANGFLAFRDNGTRSIQDGQLEGRFRDSVREKPHLSVTRRASELDCRVQSLQDIATRTKLSNLNARLTFAGYRVEACKPLQMARQRRIVASYPGSLTHIDFKTFGFLRGTFGQPSVRLGGFVVVDSLTSFASVHLAAVDDAIEAVSALVAYRASAPFPLKGIVLSDNGGPFVSDHWLSYCQKNLLIPRRIRSSHPWSNGKVEALNKTLKYECFAALAGNIGKWEEAVSLVNLWMDYYNRTRSHGGHCNMGLPPLALFQLYEKTPGDHLAKLVNLGIIKLDAEWTVRLMGQTSQLFAGSSPEDTKKEAIGLPYAFVMERSGAKLEFLPDTRENFLPPLVPGLSNPNLVLAK